MLGSNTLSGKDSMRLYIDRNMDQTGSLSLTISGKVPAERPWKA